MAISGPLRNEPFRYRKRKQLSLDGSVGGMDVNHFRHGLGPATAHSGGPSHLHSDPYDPIRAAYDWAMPDHHPSEPWFEGIGHHASQPELIGPDRPQPVSEHEETVLYRDAQMTPELTRRLIEKISESGPSADVSVEDLQQAMLSGLAPTPQESQPGQPTAEFLGSQAEHPWFDSGQMTQDMFHAAMEQVMQPALEQQPQQDLEALVQAAMQEPTPMQEDPFEMQRMMYDQQMQQMLDPFMSPGFGPGP